MSCGFLPQALRWLLDFSLFTLRSSLKYALRWHMTLTTLTPINSFNYHNLNNLSTMNEQKKTIFKIIVQTIISVLSAVAAAFGLQSCM